MAEWVTMKEAAQRLRCHEDTIKRRMRLDPDDARYLESEKQSRAGGREVWLVNIPDDAPMDAPEPAPPEPDLANANGAMSPVVLVLQYQTEMHERELARLQEQHAAELARVQESNAGMRALLQGKIDDLSQAIERRERDQLMLTSTKDELLAELRVERDAMQIQIEKLREQLVRAQRSWWKRLFG